VDVIDLILYIVAALSFAAAMLGTASRVNLVALGLLAWVCVPLIAAAQALG
jgi:hypothetical protein